MFFIYNLIHKISERPSTRLHAPPGGKSSFSIGGYDEPAKQKVALAVTPVVSATPIPVVDEVKKSHPSDSSLGSFLNNTVVENETHAVQEIVPKVVPDVAVAPLVPLSVFAGMNAVAGSVKPVQASMSDLLSQSATIGDKKVMTGRRNPSDSSMSSIINQDPAVIQTSRKNPSDSSMSSIINQDAPVAPTGKTIFLLFSLFFSHFLYMQLQEG